MCVRLRYSLKLKRKLINLPNKIWKLQKKAGVVIEILREKPCSTQNGVKELKKAPITQLGYGVTVLSMSFSMM